MRPCPLSAALAALLLLALGSCGSTGSPSEATSTRYEGGISELEIQAFVMQMADEYDAALGETTYLVLRQGAVDPTGRWLALSFLRNGMGAALDIAAGPNPDVALLDLLVLASLQAWAFERHWIPAGIDAASGAAAAARLREAEEALWSAARRYLTADQARTLRELVAAWVAEHPDQTVVSFVRFDDFTQERKLSTAVARSEASGLLADVGEATTAVEDARLFGERALWFASRYPYLLGQQAELTAYRMADQPEVREAREVLATLGRAADALADRVAALEAEVPGFFERIREERARTIEALSAALELETTRALDGLAARVEAARVAAVDHFFTRLDAERERLLAELDEAHGELAGTLAEARATAEASADAGRALTAAAEATDRLAARFDRAPGDGREPLRLADLRATAAEAHLAAERLDAALARLEGLAGSPDAERALSALDGLANALFWRGAGLIALLVGGLALVRRVPQRTR